MLCKQDERLGGRTSRTLGAQTGRRLLCRVIPWQLLVYCSMQIELLSIAVCMHRQLLQRPPWSCTARSWLLRSRTLVIGRSFTSLVGSRRKRLEVVVEHGLITATLQHKLPGSLTTSSGRQNVRDFQRLRSAQRGALIYTARNFLG